MKDQGIWLLAFSLFLLSSQSAVFLMNSRGYGWDTIGHIAEADFYMREIFPGVYGWNSFFLFGYPFHLYPPLSRIALGAASVFLGPALAADILLVLSCILTITSIFLFLRNYGYSNELCGVACVAAVVYMATTGIHVDLTLENAFKLGMISNFMALPLFFLALAYFDKSLRLSAFFSAMVVLTNMAISMMLALSLLALVLLRIARFGIKETLLRCLYLFAVVFCLSAFWLLPFASHMLLQGGNSIFDTPPLLPMATPISMLGLSCAAAAAYVAFGKGKAPKTLLQGVVLLFILFAFMLCIRQFYMDFSIFGIAFAALSAVSLLYLIISGDSFISKFYLVYACLAFAFGLAASLLVLADKSFSPFLLHAYRFNGLLFLIQAIMMSLALHSHSIQSRAKGRTAALALAAALLMVLAYISPISSFRLYLHPDESAREYDLSNVSAIGRAILHDGTIDPSPHVPYFQYYLQTHRPISNGVFIEEAGMSYVELTFSQHLLRIDTFVWGALRPPELTMFEQNYSRAAHFYSDLFWVTDIVVPPEAYKRQLDITPYLLDDAFEKMGDFNSSGVQFRHYRIGNYSVAQVRGMRNYCGKDWKGMVHDWFANASTEIYYQSCLPEAAGDAASARLQVLNYSNGKISFMVDSEYPVPVLVKETYDSGWKAYSKGKEIRVYRATPDLMAVFASGEVSMVYSPPASPAFLLLFLAGAALLAVPFSWLWLE